VFSDLTDSNGQALDQNTFVFEIGAFDPTFVPDSSNTSQWASNWRVFDRAAYSQANGYFTSTTHIMNDGTSNSPFETPSVPSFAGLEAYLWVRNGDNPVPGTEWLLTRASAWVFPVPDPTEDCCDKGVIEWSVSDIVAEVPKWGKQGTIGGPGVFTDSNPHTLQTYTFVPEPSSALLAALAGVFAVTRRRRNHA
ncbi:MAG: PEP-CTERM sorting domain-containing protein, partial [Gloeobacteraceae cyanobacterium ES-bin-144]|nr:PEP-CTERM sorting domain-containing protein [Verrucomicrobiales bacterium]